MTLNLVQVLFHLFLYILTTSSKQHFQQELLMHKQPIRAALQRAYFVNFLLSEYLQ